MSDLSYIIREGIIFSPELRSRLLVVKTAFYEEAATDCVRGTRGSQEITLDHLITT
jgi:hypothetical protein